jgi:ferredoxin
VRVSVDSDLCDARGQCNLVDPELFTLDEDGYSNIGQNKPVPTGAEDAAEQGTEVCPVQALRID